MSGPLLNWFKEIRERYVHPSKLAKKGVLGMNRRNISYISRYNSRHLYPLVDDKLQTKKMVLEAGITAPDLYGVVREQHEVKDLAKL
ncbi:MAG: alpha-L-glutamate ligase-like protein, partial [Methylophaga sp.]|nr:alpha-L-glutamate ligase-like protein [Methylophaga sp.]